MRYRATIFIDLWHDTEEEASKEIEKIVKSIPNSFIDGLAALPHGSDISLFADKPKGS
jgi:hypothetical protein|tara:strand:- start:1305 stop:1478 length:174 start_codon:yes stop_codon:yes gene_type:complete